MSSKTEEVKSKTFEDQLQDHLKSGIGDLLTDEELKTVVSKGMDKILYEPDEVIDHFESAKTLAPLAEKPISEVSKALIKDEVKAFIKTQELFFLEAVRTLLKRRR